MRDYLGIILGKAMSAGAQMIMLLILASRVSPELLGPVLAVYSLCVAVSVAGDLGLGTLAMRERAYGSRVVADRAIGTAQRLAMLAGIVGTASLAAAALFIPALLPTVPLFLWAVAERNTETRLMRLTADGLVGRVALVNATRRLFGLALFMIGLLAIPADWSFTLALAVAAVGTQLVVAAWTPLNEGEGLVDRRALIRSAIPFAFSSVSGQLRNLDVPLVAAFVLGVSAAAYGFGVRIASPVMLVYSAISGLVLVQVRRAGLLSLRLIVAGLLAVPTVGALLLILSRGTVQQIVEPFINWVDAEAATTMTLVAAGYLFAGSGIIFGSICVAFHLQRRQVVVNLTTVAASLMCIGVSAAITQQGIVPALLSLACYIGQALVLATIILTHRPEEDS